MLTPDNRIAVINPTAPPGQAATNSISSYCCKRQFNLIVAEEEFWSAYERNKMKPEVSNE